LTIPGVPYLADALFHGSKRDEVQVHQNLAGTMASMTNEDFLFFVKGSGHY
jgi:hypothetical protein